MKKMLEENKVRDLTKDEKIAMLEKRLEQIKLEGQDKPKGVEALVKYDLVSDLCKVETNNTVQGWDHLPEQMLFAKGYWYSDKERFNKGECIAWIKYKFSKPVVINGFALENVGIQEVKDDNKQIICRNNHMMEYITKWRCHGSCDGCRRDRGQTYFRCHTCDYDLCDNCSKNYVLKYDGWRDPMDFRFFARQEGKFQEQI